MWCLDDISPTARRVTGNTRIVQALYRRLITPRGRLGADKSYGFCIADMLGETMTASEIAALKQGIASECLKEPEVRRVQVEATWNASTRTLSLRVTAIGPDGSFGFSATADETGLSLTT